MSIAHSLFGNSGIIVMNSQSIQKEIINWNIQTFQNLTSIVDLIHRVEQKQPPKQHDYRLRDFYFHPSFDIFGLKNRTTFIEHAAGIVKNFLSFNQLGYLQSLSFEHHMEKHRFWNSLYKKNIKNEKDQQARKTVRSIVWTYRLFPLFLFMFGAVTIMSLSGINKMTLRKQAVGLVMATFMCNLFVRTKKSSEIFYLIPPLADENMEKERLDLVNKGIVLDGKINEIEIQPSFVNELIEEAEKSTDYNQKKVILEAAGFIVVDDIDFEY